MLLQEAQKYHVEDLQLQEIKNQLALIQESETAKDFEAHLNEILEWKDKGKKAEYQKELGEIILRWKEDYRSISKG